ALPLLQQQFRIERARMRLRLAAPASGRAALGALLEERGGVVESEAPAEAGFSSLTVQVEPGVFRDLHAFMQRETQNQGRIEVLSFAVTAEGGAGGDDEYGAALAAAAAVAATAAAAPRPVARGEGDGEGEADEAAPAAAPPSAAAAAAAARRARGAAPAGAPGADGEAGPSGRVVYARGPVSGLPEEFASRRERFEELDALQPGWQVELRERGDSVDAVFYSPAGARAGPFAAARRAALAWKQAGGGAG
ncbi:hypothetical protein Rsub_07178, partial [Raphidocelis subcapitata]